jgi:leucyl aminopeptidase
MRSSLKNDLSKINKNDTVILFIDEDSIKNGVVPEFFGSGFLSGLDLNFFKASSYDILSAKLENKPAIVLCGLGNIKKYNAENFRNCAAAAVKFCITRKIRKASVIVPDIKDQPAADILRAVAEGSMLANYVFNKYKSDKDTENPLDNIEFYTSSREDPAIVKEVEFIANNTSLCRDLVNDTTDEVNPVSFAGMAMKISADSGLTCTVYEKKDIEQMKMGLLLAVNRGSNLEPRLIVLDYAGDGKSKKVFGLVGKGITFDSGGMDLKPPASMETMRSDMAGAAAVLYTMKTLAELKVKKNVRAVIPLTENMLSSNAFRPGDIYTSYSGKTVEIGNTDAEGRLILADALSFMEKEIKPDVIVDLATLTGACIVTFGETVAGFLSTDEAVSSALESSAAKTGEKLWRLPFYEDYDDRMKSEIADLNNMSSEKNAGTISGAVFFRSFIEKTPWAHIDIAGTSWYTKARGYRPKNATGYGIRLLLDLIRNWK